MSRSLSRLNPSGMKEFFFGVPYYPEHWSEKEREKDPELMKNAGVNVVRMGEFAWDMMEPSEGVFDFSFFDDQVDRLGAAGIKTFFCTPTAAPPRWLSEKHPEILRVGEDGGVMQHGSRQHACTASPVFIEYSRRITKAVAEHFADNPNIAGFQTDNELDCHFQWCHCDSCTKEFRKYLRLKYKTIEQLNKAWGNSFWSQTLSDFDQVLVPKHFAPTHHNPGAMLDYRLFSAWTVTRFHHEQIKILRSVNPGWIIFHNGIMRGVDYRGDFSAELDVLGFDSYPHFCADTDKRPGVSAFSYDNVRAMAGCFIVPEMQAGAGGQTNYFNSLVVPGDIRKNTYRAVGHGADGIMYFRWRTCRFGAEEYWRGIIDHDNIPRRRYQEMASIGKEIKNFSSFVLGSIPENEVAVGCGDYIADQIHETYSLGMPDIYSVASEVHNYFYSRHYFVGCAHPADDLSGLKLYILPHWEYVSGEWVENMKKWVSEGGVLIIGARCGTKTVQNSVTSESFPGVLRELAGVSVYDYGKVYMDVPKTYSFSVGGSVFPAFHWFEELEPDPGTRAVGIWTERPYAGRCAVTMRKFGAGTVFYAGTYLSGALAEHLSTISGVELTHFDLPSNVEIMRRRGNGAVTTFVINNSDDVVDVSGILDSGRVVVGENSGEVPPDGVCIFRCDL